VKLKKQTKSVPPALEVFRSLPSFPAEEEYTIPKTRGNPKASILIIAPPCDKVEYEKGVPLSNDCAIAFHMLLQEEIQFDTNKDAFIISCCRFGLKPKKHNTDPIIEFVRQCADKEIFQHYVCVGDDAFKFIFGSGKKPSMQSLAGYTMRVKETGYKPLFVFPSVKMLAPVFIGDSREDYFLARMQDQWTEKFRKFSAKLKQFLKEK
jgi:hypothetical protein